MKDISSPRARFDDNILYIYIKTCIATAYDKNMYVTEDYSYKRSLAIKQCRKGGSTLARIFPDSIPKVPPSMRQLKYKFRRDGVDMVVADRKYAVLGSCQEVHTSVCTPRTTQSLLGNPGSAQLHTLLTPLRWGS